MAPLSQTEAFLAKAETAIDRLFRDAREANELHFVLSLGPELRGEQALGWCAWEETNRAFDEYVAFLDREDGCPKRFKLRVVLGFYSHLAEASGYYETPKNLLRVLSGDGHSLIPFRELNRFKATSRIVIPPNANAVFADLIAHSSSVGLNELAEVFRDAFDPDIRNGYAHADYMIWSDGLRLRRKAGGSPRVVSWAEFDELIDRAVGFYSVLRSVRAKYSDEYRVPRRLVGALSGQPPQEWEVMISGDGGVSISSC